MTKNAYRKLLKDTLLFLKRNEHLSTYADVQTASFFSSQLQQDLPRKKEEKVITLKTVSSASYYEKPNKIYKKPKTVSSLKQKEIVPITFEEEKKKPTLKLEPITKTAVYPDNIQTLLQAVAPQISYVEEVPNDKKAKEIAQSWKYQSKTAPISILTFSLNIFSKGFVKQLQKALQTLYIPSSIIDGMDIEKNDYWNRFLSTPSIELIIMQDKDLKNSPNLLCHIKEVPNKSEKFLHNIPLFLLPDLSLYEKNFHLKRNLYKALKHKLTRLKSCDE